MQRRDLVRVQLVDHLAQLGVLDLGQEALHRLQVAVAAELPGWETKKKGKGVYNKIWEIGGFVRPPHTW